MSELLKALQEVEDLKAKVKKLEEQEWDLRGENSILKDDIHKSYPFFMAIKVTGDPRYRNIIMRGKHNYYSECKLSISELREMAFNEVYKVLRQIEEYESE